MPPGLLGDAARLIRERPAIVVGVGVAALVAVRLLNRDNADATPAAEDATATDGGYGSGLLGGGLGSLGPSYATIPSNGDLADAGVIVTPTPPPVTPTTPTPPPATPPPAPAPPPATPPPAPAPPPAPSVPAANIVARCDSVRIRTAPKLNASILATVNRGATAHQLDKVAGASYTSPCGGAGSTWRRIDYLNGKRLAATGYTAANLWSAR